MPAEAGSVSAAPAASDQVRRHLADRLRAFDARGTADEWRARRDGLRQRTLDLVFLRGVDPAVLAGDPAVVWGDERLVDGETPVLVRTLRFEALPRYWVPAVLYSPVAAGPFAAVLGAGGHHDAGLAAPYVQRRGVELAQGGVVALNFEFVGMGQLSADSEIVPGVGASLHGNLAALELVGIGAAAPMYVAMRRGLDVLAGLDHVDGDRIAMTGLSGGGWQTIVLSALDDRIAASVPVAGYTSTRARVDEDCDVGDLEQVPADLATVLDYQTMTALLAPRPALVILNEHDDCCFRTATTRPVVYDAVRPVYEAFGVADRFEIYSNLDPGDHNFGADNRQRFQAFVARHLGGSPAEPSADDTSQVGVFDRRELCVELPDDQLTVRQLATERTLVLRHGRAASPTRPAELRRRLAEVLRLKHPDAVATIDGAVAADGDGDGRLTLTVGRWVLPGHRRRRHDAHGWAVLDLADAGAAVATDLDREVSDRLGIDLLGTGTMTVSAAQAMLLACAGDRLLGLQVDAIAATARWLGEGARVWIRARGPTTSMAAVLAAAVHPGLVAGVRTTETRLRSFADLITRAVRLDEQPALFCADLLTVADVDDLAELLDDDGAVWETGEAGGAPFNWPPVDER